MSLFRRVKRSLGLSVFVYPVFGIGDRVDTTIGCPGYYCSNGEVVALRWSVDLGGFQYTMDRVVQIWVDEKCLVLR